MGIVDSRTIFISLELLNIIAEIDEFKGLWEGSHKLTPEKLATLKKVATIESIGSSTRIEGAKLSDREIESLLSSKLYQSRDEKEVAGYAYVCEEIYNNYSSIPLKENVIKQLHSWLLQYTDKDKSHRGEYKKTPTRIEAFNENRKSLGVLFETTSPFETPFKMEALIQWTNAAFKEKSVHPLIVIALFTVLFLAIHPFQDGNGRLSRLLTTLLMLKCGYLYSPYSSLESVIEANKEAYYKALQHAQKSWQKNKADWSRWLLFFFQCLQRQKKRLEIKLEREQTLIKKLSPLSQEILELLKSDGQLGIGDFELLTKANRNTLKKTLAMLAKENYIERNGLGKASRYVLKHVQKIMLSV